MDVLYQKEHISLKEFPKNKQHQIKVLNNIFQRRFNGHTKPRDKTINLVLHLPGGGYSCRSLSSLTQSHGAGTK